MISACKFIVPVPVSEQTLNVKFAVEPLIACVEGDGLSDVIKTVTVDGELEYFVRLTVTVGFVAPDGFAAYTCTVAVPQVAPLAALR